MNELSISAATHIEDVAPVQQPWLEFWDVFKRNRGAVIGLALIVIFSVVALAAPLLAPHSPQEIFPDALLLKPGTPGFWLGTDDVGRDLLSRLIYGARVSLGVGFLVVAFSATVGTILGLLAGYMGGWTERVIMRLIDIFMALPSILLAIVVVAILGPSLTNAILAVSVVAIPNFVRLVRAVVLAEKTKSYVAAAHTFGASPLRQMFVNILPNCWAPIIIQATLGFSDGILNAAALGFLGLGAQPPTPEWGTMLADARAFIESAPWLLALPGGCIIFSVLGFNLLGDGLRDALDPKLRK